MTSQPTKRSRSHSCHFRIPVVLGNIPELISDHDSDENAPKRARSMLSHSHTDWVSTYSSALGSLDAFPQEILHDHILPFLTPNPLTFMDLQLTCKALYKFCHSVKVKQSLQLIGDKDCILHGVESKSQAITRLFEFAKCGNLHAEYMMGMIVTYCYEHPLGISLLKRAARNGCTRSRYYLQCLQSPFTHRDFDLEQLLGSMTERNLRLPLTRLLSILGKDLFPTETEFQHRRTIRTTRDLEFELEAEEEDSIPTLDLLAHKHHYLWEQWERMQVTRWDPSDGSWGGTASSLSSGWFCHSDRLPLPLEWSLWTLLLK